MRKLAISDWRKKGESFAIILKSSKTHPLAPLSVR